MFGATLGCYFCLYHWQAKCWPLNFFSGHLVFGFWAIILPDYIVLNAASESFGFQTDINKNCYVDTFSLLDYDGEFFIVSEVCDLKRFMIFLTRLFLFNSVSRQYFYIGASQFSILNTIKDTVCSEAGLYGHFKGNLVQLYQNLSSLAQSLGCMRGSKTNTSFQRNV